ncbi:MAG: hypothetical protein EXS15_08480 [Phycisphaerales bacterium]|nr:hypothetical protein [Phycisphaerales bacterium]
MNKSAFTFGMVLSVGLHTWLIWPPAKPHPESAKPQPDGEAKVQTSPVTVRQLQPEPLPELQPEPVPEPIRDSQQVAERPPVPNEVPQPVEPPAAIVELAKAPVPELPAPVAPAEPIVTQQLTPESVKEQIEVFAAARNTLAEMLPAPVVQAQSASVDPVSEMVQSHPPTQLAEAVIGSVSEVEQPIETPRFAETVVQAPIATLSSWSMPPLAPRTVTVPQSPKFPWLKRKTVASTTTPSPTKPSKAPVQLADASAVPATAPSSIVRTSSTARDRGTVKYSSPVPQDPVARIAWGDASNVVKTMESGRMRLVTVDADLKVVGGIERSGSGWVRTGIPRELSSYSNRVRVVDHVAGFAAPASMCIAGEHLAVAVPVGLERRIDHAMDDAARRSGLSRYQVAACFGKLITQSTGVEFQIDGIERRIEQ